jgi:hypothetical protein
MSMSFRKYLKCQKKRKMEPIYGPKKMSQLWTEIGKGFKEYSNVKKKSGAIYGSK